MPDCESNVRSVPLGKCEASVVSSGVFFDGLGLFRVLAGATNPGAYPRRPGI